MDTRLKKFNSALILKAVTVLLCLSCVLNCVSQALTIVYKIDDKDICHYAYDDAFYEILFKNKDVTQTDTFKYRIRQYSDLLETMIGTYGDGSEKAYKQWKNSIDASNDAFFKTARENIIKHIIVDEFRVYLALAKSGIVVPLGILETTEYSGNAIDLYDDYISDAEDYDYLCSEVSDKVVKYPGDKDLKKKAEKLEADGVFELHNFYQVVEYDENSDEDVIKESYKPGYYAFKIDDEAFRDMLVKRGQFVSDNYGSAEQFEKTYKMYEDDANKFYPSGRYFIRDASGNVYTNVKGLGKNSTNEQIQKKFEALGFYCQGVEHGDLILPDGMFYTYGGFHREVTEPAEVYDYGDYSVVVVTTKMETAVSYGEAVSVPVTEPTTMYMNAYDSTPFVDEDGSNWYCIIGVDMNPGTYTETDLLRNSGAEIAAAKEIMTDILYTAGVLGTLFLVCFVYLIVRAGRRRGDKNIYLMKTDRMFTDWRIAIDVLLGFGTVMLFVFATDEFYDYDNEIFIKISCLLAVVFTVLLLDLVLFIVRHIKARTLLKNLFPVWLVRKSYGFFRSRASEIRNAYKEKIKARIDEKFLYTKEFAKGTLIRIGIVVVANLLIGFCASIEVMDNGTCFISVPWVLFNIVVLVWVIRFVGGMHKIFTALEEIRQGNYGVQINLYALPATLRESAEKVMSLRDGLKTAVDEAVKQEQTKTELITNVSHDLKTPLTSIINYVELLKKCNITDGDAKEYLDILGEKSDRLKKLIEDLVEASKASTGNIKVELVQVSLNEMISQLLGEHADGLEKRKLNVIAEIPAENLMVKADGKLLYRVMENLIVNVEKYSLYGTRVYVTVKQEGGYGTVTFKNISEQPLNITAEQLKERFVRGDESRSTEGNGLGLSIAQSLCTVQGGELEISINGDLFTAAVRLKK